MAKRRSLKKDISRIAGELFSEALVCKLFIPGSDTEKAEAVMTRILDMQDNFIRRVGHPDGKENPALVKAYYRKLVADLQTEVDAIAQQLGELNKQPGE